MLSHLPIHEYQESHKICNHMFKNAHEKIYAQFRQEINGKEILGIFRGVKPWDKKNMKELCF